MTDRNMADFVVLEELSNIDPRFFFSQMIDGGKFAREYPSKEFRDSEVGKCVWYCKDWLFGEWDPAWITDLQRVLPDRLRPRNRFDLLGGLTGDAQVDVMMAYLGIGGTRTPLHLDKAASNAYNCVVWSESPTSVKRWWIFHRDDTSALNAHIQKDDETKTSHLQEDVHWIDPEEFEDIPGLEHQSYSFEQALGELVIVPHNSPHCVINQGGMTFACAANIIDANVAMDAYLQSINNKKLRVKTVYKVAGAIWGTMLKGDLPLHVMKKVLEACQSIYDSESNGFQRISSLDTDKKLALEFVNFVVCDYCQADVFNSYVLVKEHTFCHDEVCVEEGRAKAKEMGARLLKVVPKTLSSLMKEITAAKEKCRAEEKRCSGLK